MKQQQKNTIVLENGGEGERKKMGSSWNKKSIQIIITKANRKEKENSFLLSVYLVRALYILLWNNLNYLKNNFLIFNFYYIYKYN